MYIGYILFFRAFLVALQETMTTPRTLEEGLDGRHFMFWMCISLISFSNKMKNKNRSVFWHLNPAPPILECKVYASSCSCIPNLQTPCKHLFIFITLMDSMVIWRTSTPLLNRKQLITPFIKLYTSMWRGSSGLCDTEIQIHSISNSGFFIFCLFFVDC